MMIDELEEKDGLSFKLIKEEEVLSSGKLSEDDELNYLTESRDSYRHHQIQKVTHNRTFTNNQQTSY